MKKQLISIMCTMLASIMILTGCSSDKNGSHENREESDTGKYIYLAGPFFNDEEVKNIEYAESVLEEKGYSFFSPMRHTVDAEFGTTEWAEKIFEMDVEELKKADTVVLMYYGNNSDSGTAWECGYAYSIGKPIVVVHINRYGDSNLMIHCGSTTNIYLENLADYDFEEMPVYEYEGQMF